MSTVLILTSSIDVHANAVANILQSNNIKVVRINSDEIHESNQIEYNSLEYSNFRIISEGEKINTDSIRSIWYRKPSFIPHEQIRSHIEGLSHSFRVKQILNLLQNFEYNARLNSVKIINSIESDKNASNKLYQLNIAREIGFFIPHTLVSADPKTILNFLESNQNMCVTKTLSVAIVEYGNFAKGFYTYKLSKNLFNNLRHCSEFNQPILIQELIKKKYELRITVVGNQVFACRIDKTYTDSDEVDIRKIDHSIAKYTAYQLPDTISQQCLRLSRYFGLHYAAIDMCRDINGNYIFFELNPNGQYLWIENYSGLQISAAIANELNT